jgi:hypothetical protein
MPALEALRQLHYGPIPRSLARSDIASKEQSRALKKTGYGKEHQLDHEGKEKRQRESWEGAAVDPAVFAIQLSILNRMSFLAGLGELGRPAALTVPALSLQLPKRGIRHES